MITCAGVRLGVERDLSANGPKLLCFGQFTILDFGKFSFPKGRGWAAQEPIPRGTVGLVALSFHVFLANCFPCLSPPSHASRFSVQAIIGHRNPRRLMCFAKVVASAGLPPESACICFDLWGAPHTHGGGRRVNWNC